MCTFINFCIRIHLFIYLHPRSQQDTLCRDAFPQIRSLVAADETRGENRICGCAYINCDI